MIWYPVSVLPTENTAVLIYVPGGAMCVAYLSITFTEQFWRSSETGDYLPSPTHWAKLPPRP